MEEVNAVDLSMVFAPLLFRRKTDPNEYDNLVTLHSLNLVTAA